MCGIFGVFGSEVNKSNLYGSHKYFPLVFPMHRRGPDNHEILNHNNFTVNHSRLSIIDHSLNSDQPFENERYIFAYNGELYNYKELAKEENISDLSDGRVFFHLLSKYGMSCLDRCDGMWAFSLYDKKDNKLYLCRDQFGEKPLFVYIKNNELVFSSQISYIRYITNEKEINFGQINRYLTCGYRSLFKDQSNTFFKNINALIPGKYYTFKLKNNKLMQDEDLYFLCGDACKYVVPDILEIKDCLISSIGKRLRSDVPLAFCLSGGVDSNTIISIAKKFYNYDVHGYTIRNSDDRYDESKIVDQVVKELELKHTYIDIDKDNFLYNLEDVIKNNSSPLVTISYYLNWLMMRQIAEDGYKVVLSGTGGDELFAGYYDHYLYHLYITWLNSQTLYKMVTFPKWKEYVLPNLREGSIFRDPELFIKQPYLRDYLYSDKSFSELLNINREVFYEKQYSLNALKNRMLNELFHESIPCILHDDDLNSMYFSIENRSPFLSKDIFEMSLKIDPQFFIEHGYNKYLLREAMSGIVPDCVLKERKKVGFNCSVFDMIKDMDFLFNWKNKIWNYFDRDPVMKWWVDPQTSFGPEESKFVFNLINIKIFLEIFG